MKKLVLVLVGLSMVLGGCSTDGKSDQAPAYLAMVSN